MLAKYAPRNLKKRFKQEKKKKNLLQSKMKEVTGKPNILEKKSAQLSQSLVKTMKTTLKLTKYVSCLKIQNKKVYERSNSQSYVQSFQDQFF